MDLTKRPGAVGIGLKRSTKTDLAALGLVVTDLGASSHMHEKDPAERAKQLDEGRRFIDLAHAMRRALRARCSATISRRASRARRC